MRELEDILNEIGVCLEEDTCLDLYGCCIYKSCKYETKPQTFTVAHDPFPSYWEDLSPKFETLLEAVNWLIEYRKNER